jgi:uncharacterized protein (DUF305 family)
MTLRVRITMAVAVALTLPLAGCTSAPAGPPAQQQAPVIVPGGPGEAGTVVPPERAGQHEQHTAPNEADVTYMTMMVPHHRQAITMTDLVGSRASEEQVRAIAGRIASAQGAEIALMSDWLTRYGRPVPGAAHEGHAGHGDQHGAHDHAQMPGMATPAQLDALAAATGREFDRLFLDLMIAHHQGALTMAERQLAGGVETRAQEMAQEVMTGQSAEIERMRTLRARY